MAVKARAEITLTDVTDGDQGPQGPKGDTGPTGPQGPKGPAGRDGVMFYGVCSTANSVSAKTVNITGFELYTGVAVTVLFENANICDSPTLNVNSTGAKSMQLGWSNHNVLWRGKTIVTFVYDGTYWNIANSDVFGYRTNLGAMVSESSDTLKYFSIDSYNGLEIRDSGMLRASLLAPGKSASDGSTEGCLFKAYDSLSIGCWKANYYALKAEYDGSVSTVTLASNKVVINAPTSFSIKVGATTGLLKDWVVASGTSGIWQYRKWASGRAEAHGTKRWKLTKNGTYWWGSVSLPFTFYKTANSMNGFALLIAGGDYYVNTPMYSDVDIAASSVDSFSMAAANVSECSSSAPGYVNVSYDVYGRWKA